jgi:hypothetical protein
MRRQLDPEGTASVSNSERNAHIAAQLRKIRGESEPVTDNPEGVPTVNDRGPEIRP